MTKFRFTLTANCITLISLILASCNGVPNIPNIIAPTPTMEAEATTAIQQTAYPAALIETDPPLNSVIGHQSPITFYFNQAMNKPSVESAMSGLPSGTFTWIDEATLTFTPVQPYQPNTKFDIIIEDSIQSASGFGIAEPIQLSFTVADYLRGTNLLPKANTTDVNVDAAIAVSFNQPVVPLGADSSSLPVPFVIQPSVEGRGEWINTSTYIFYPEPVMLGGTEYTVSMNADLKTVSGVGLDGSVVNAWKFVTARPRVVSVSPSADEFLPPNPEIKLTFNQPMDRQSTQLNFILSGTDGSVSGTYAWNDDDTELTFLPDSELTRGVGYTLNVGAGAKSQSGMTLGEAYGTVLRTYDNFSVSDSNVNYSTTSFTFSAPLAGGNYENLVGITPAVDNLDVNVDESTLYIFGSFIPDTDYSIELSESISDRWGQSLGAPFNLDVHTPALPSSLNLQLFNSRTAFVRPDEPVLYANIVNVQNTDITVAPLSLQDFFSLQSSPDLQQAYTSPDASTYSQTFDFLSSQSTEVKLDLTQENNQLLPGLYYV
ncbi:MAG TPA: Ig-like domain-containing protein, partial [Anaerolineales bacterium]|nr:Ig-like domain-containing protein [Anaerolineales bacterium]